MTLKTAARHGTAKKISDTALGCEQLLPQTNDIVKAARRLASY